MPESSAMPKNKRPSSAYLETGRQLLSEVEKHAVADSNKHVSMLLARSRSLDILSKLPSSLLKDDKSGKNFEDKKSSISSDTAESCGNNGIPSCLKDNCSIIQSEDDKSLRLTLLKDKSELNNNHKMSNENYCDGANRSSCSSTISSASSSSSSKSNHGKSQRRSQGGSSFQQVSSKTEPIRVTGYLEKRSKVLGWKKFWFVLDGRLLTYYKSKADYESLSACCGCINLGIASTVRPIQIKGCKGYPLQIVTRSQVYYLRSPEKPHLEQWLIAIQEAASSPRSSSVLTSWNSYSGSQYFNRNSFTSQSQWSLNNSSDDITDRLGNLPDTFYQKRDSLLQLPRASSQVSPAIQKCHSFTSLQNPVVNNFGNRKVLISSSENLRDLQDNSKLIMQQSTSLLVLDSSPQAAELRKELTRKLLLGSSKNGSVEGDSETVPTPKFLLLSAKKKLELGPTGDNESHDYAEISEYSDKPPSSKPYENCDVEKYALASLNSASQGRNYVRSESSDSDIYEHIETVDQSMAPVIWEPLSDGNHGVANSKRFPTHRMSTSSNRNSLVSISEVPEDVSITPSPIKTPGLSSIQEASWRSEIDPYKSFHKNYEDDLSSCRSESFRSLPCVEKEGKKRKGKAFSGFLSKVFGKGKGKTTKSDSYDDLNRPMVISGPVDLRKEMQETKPSPALIERRPFAPPSTIQKESSNEAVKSNPNPSMIGSRMAMNNTVVMDELRQKMGNITLKRTNSKDSSSGRESESPPKELVKSEPRVPYVPRTSESTSVSGKPVLVFQTESKCSESNTDDDALCEKEKEIQVASICLSPENDTLPKPDVKRDMKPPMKNEEIILPPPPQFQAVVPTVAVNEDLADGDVDFQSKLAKFNRLSQQLSATFIAMNPTLHSSQVNRSHSYKHKHKSTEVIPPLPPKKKHGLPTGSVGAFPIYDVPSNNRPVRRSSSLSEKENSIGAYIRGITKKNSTPDIVISGNAKLFGNPENDRKDFRRAFDSSSDESVHAVKPSSSPSIPPLRPPKPKPPAKPKSFDSGGSRSKCNSETSSASSEAISEPPEAPPLPIPALALPQLEMDSPTSSNKSLDIDTLDALSDIGLSDTKASNSPPDSPKVCPIHPKTNEDLSISTIARTPDSLVTISDSIVPDSLIGTPDTEIYQAEVIPTQVLMTHETPEPISINKLEILIDNNDGSPSVLGFKSPIESHADSLERNVRVSVPVVPEPPSQVYQNIQFATVSTLIQEFETVQENEEEISELYDDFPAEFYTPTPSSFSGYAPSEVSSTSADSFTTAPPIRPSANKSHARIDAIRNSGMEQLEAFLSFGSSSEDGSYESCVEHLSEEGKPQSACAVISLANHKAHPSPMQITTSGGINRTGAISRLGHSSAIGHIQKILTTSDAN